MLRVFIPFLSPSSLVQLALFPDNPDELRHTQDSFPLPVVFFFSVQSLYVTYIPSEEKCRP